MSSTSARNESDMDDIEMLLDSSVSPSKCIELSSFPVSVMFLISFFLFCFAYFGIWKCSLPLTIENSAFLELQPTKRKMIPLTLRIQDLNPLYNNINVDLFVTRYGNSQLAHKGVRCNKSITINLVNETKTTNLSIKSPSTITFLQNSLESQPIHIFSHPIDYFEEVEIMLHLYVKIPISKVRFEWRIDSPMKRGKTSAAQISLLSLLLFSIISFIMNKQYEFLDSFLYALIVLGLLAVNPLTLQIDFSNSVDFLTPIFFSFFIHFSKYFIILWIRKLWPAGSAQGVQTEAFQINIKPYYFITFLILSCNTSFSFFASFNPSFGEGHQPITNISLLISVLFEICFFSYLVYLIYRTIEKIPSSNLYFPFFSVAVASTFSSTVVMIAQYLSLLSANIYNDLMLFVSVYVLATCFYSFMRLNIPRKSKAGMVVIKNKFQVQSDHF